ncbi:MAG: four-helix bundle copper-binding protein [Salinisphaera sp.]|uniref:four-helix bundle copper-binding protein n=1 Tax=Salinisphaera sp. TaxID=1914330 RepID=UPI003C7CE09C
MQIQERLKTHSNPVSYSEQLADCIAACLECSQCCSVCADACLQHDGMAQCIRTDLDCADICSTTVRVLSRQTHIDKSAAATLVKACRDACQTCARDCESHSDHHKHCAECADSCNRCAKACDELLGHLEG